MLKHAASDSPPSSAEMRHGKSGGVDWKFVALNSSRRQPISKLRSSGCNSTPPQRMQQARAPPAGTDMTIPQEHSTTAIVNSPF
jgi:hypothetical protein